MKTNPSTRDLLMQLRLHTKVFEGRSCRAFSQQPRAATAAGKAFLGHHHLPPDIPVTLDCCIYLTSTLYHPRASFCRLVFPDPHGDRIPQLQVPLLHQGIYQPLSGGWAGRCWVCISLSAAVWEQNSEPRRAPWAWGRIRREMSTLHGASLQVYPGLQLKKEPRLNAYELSS